MYGYATQGHQMHGNMELSEHDKRYIAEIDRECHIWEVYTKETTRLRKLPQYSDMGIDDDKFSEVIQSIGGGRFSEIRNFKTEDEAKMAAMMTMEFIRQKGLGNRKSMSGIFDRMHHAIIAFTKIWIKYQDCIDAEYIVSSYKGVTFQRFHNFGESIKKKVLQLHLENTMWDMWDEIDPETSPDGIGNLTVWLPREMVEDVICLTRAVKVERKLFPDIGLL